MNGIKNYRKGDLVAYTHEESHRRAPVLYPAPGTVGQVVSAFRQTVFVRWPQGSTGYPGPTGVDVSRVELAEGGALHGVGR